MNMKPNIFLLAFFLIGCGTIKETTTTTTLPVTIPPVVIHDTVKSYIAWERTGYAFVNLDSLKEWTLINLCKGEKTIDTAGIKETISYSYKRTIRTLADSLKNLTRVVGILKIDLDKKEQIIQGTKTISQKESTPGDWGDLCVNKVLVSCIDSRNYYWCNRINYFKDENYTSNKISLGLVGCPCNPTLSCSLLQSLFYTNRDSLIKYTYFHLFFLSNLERCCI